MDLPANAWERRDEKEVRDAIVLAYWPLVTRVAGKIRQGLPDQARDGSQVEEDDLRSYGVMGLYRAIQHYEPSRGHAFDKYAVNAIRGVILDELRSLDWAPRSLRKRQRDLEKAERELIRQLGRFPTIEEIAEALRWTTQDVTATRRQVEASWPTSLDELRGEAAKDLYEVVADSQAPVEEEVVLGHHDSHEHDRSTVLTEQMAGFIKQMPPQKKAVLVLCYYLDMKQADVARALGIPESRVSSVHIQVMDEFHARLAELLVVND